MAGQRAAPAIYEENLCSLPLYMLESANERKNGHARASALATPLRIIIGRQAKAFHEQGGTGQLNWSKLSAVSIAVETVAFR
jgi:hypothetical protein